VELHELALVLQNSRNRNFIFTSVFDWTWIANSGNSQLDRSNTDASGFQQIDRSLKAKSFIPEPVNYMEQMKHIGTCK
jgi:hypothetical protein